MMNLLPEFRIQPVHSASKGAIAIYVVWFGVGLSLVLSWPRRKIEL